MPFRLIVTLLSLIHFTASVSAKPKSIQADVELATCKWAAEVLILSVAPSPGKGWAPTITVQLPKTAKRIFFGQKPGGKIQVHPTSASYDGTTKDLQALAGTGQSVLMVVNKDDQIVMVGAKRGPDSYLLRTWYDYNAWWIYATDKQFGKRLPSKPMSSIVVGASEIRALLKNRR